MKDKKLVFYGIILILLFLHTTLNTYVPSLILNYIAIVMTAIVAILFSRKIGDEFLIIIMFYVLSHYMFASYQGGTQNLIFFAVLVFSRKIKIFRKQNNALFMFALLVFVSHVFGMIIKSVAPMEDSFLGTASLISYLGVFLAMSSLRISKSQFGLFVKAATVMMILMFLSQINSRYGIIISKSPVIGYSAVHNQAGQYFRSMMGSSPLTAEFAFMNLILGIGLLASIRNRHEFNFGKYTLALYVIFSTAVMLLTTNRSTVYLSVAAIFIILMVKSVRISRQSFRLWFIVIFALVLVFAFSSQLGLGFLADRLLEIDYGSISLETVESGESINRSTAFELGNVMLMRENWLIGYGWSTHPYNRIAWFGTADQLRGDPHSLYYALPMLFGWIGSFAFLAIVMSPILIGLNRLIRKNFHDNDSKSLSWIFVLIFGLFMINEIKQGFIVSPNYFFIIMVWLGLAVSIQTFGFRSDLGSVQRRA